MFKLRLSAFQLLAFVVAILAIIDSSVHISGAKGEDARLSLVPGATPAKVLTLMSFRIAVSVLFIIFGTVCSFFPRLNFLLSALYTGAVLVLALLSCTVIQFHGYVLSLLVHLFALCSGFSLLLSQMFTYYEVNVTLAEKENGHQIGDGDVNSQQKLKSTNNRGPVARYLTLLSQNMMAFGTLSAVAVAIVFGVFIRNNDPHWTPRQIVYVGFVGELFLRMLKCLILPLIFSSLVFAIGNIDARLSGKIALRAVSYYFSTTFIAIFIGIVLVVIIQPGKDGNLDTSDIESVPARNVTTTDTILDLVRNLLPSNILEATMYTYSTKLTCTPTDVNHCLHEEMSSWPISSDKIFSSNILGVVMFSVVLGVMFSRIPERPIMVDFFRGFNNAMMEMTTQVIQITPVAVIFLVLPQIIKVKDLSVLFGAIGWYSLTVTLGIFCQAMLTLPIIYMVLTRKNPLTLIKHLTPAMATAFGTSSSSATMPVTFTCLEEGAKLDKRIVRFCIPVGATINMDGTALYEAVAAIFIAQYRNVDLNMVKIIIISITATAASIGAAGIPQAGLVTMIIVLNAIGLNAEDAALIVVVDWMLDRIRTMINVLGDAFGSAIVDHLSRAEMDELSHLAGTTMADYNSIDSKRPSQQHGSTPLNHGGSNNNDTNNKETIEL